MRKRMTIDEGYRHYEAMINKLQSKYGVDVGEMKLTKQEYRLQIKQLQYDAQFGVTSTGKKKHFIGIERASEKFARTAVYSQGSEKQAKQWRDVAKTFGFKDVEKRTLKSLRAQGLPNKIKELMSEINRKGKVDGLSGYAISKLIGQEIFGSL